MYPVPFVSDVRDNIRIAEQAERLGYDSVWGNDHIATQSYVLEDFGQSPSYFSPLITLAAIAEHTTTLKLCTALLVLPFRQPGLLPKSWLRWITFAAAACVWVSVSVPIGKNLNLCSAVPPTASSAAP